MKKYSFFALIFFAACTRHVEEESTRITTLQIVDRNGFSETISSKERLVKFQNTNFLGSQPYKKTIRIFSHDKEGRVPSIVTSYHENGTVWQCLEVLSGRANGTYREWFPNGQLHLEAQLIEGIGDLHFEAQESWVFDGINRVWDERGDLTAEIPYQHGLQEGETKFFYPSGGVKQAIPFEKGVITGTLQHFSEEGSLTGEFHYQKGVLFGKSYFLGDSEQPAFEEEYIRGEVDRATYYDFAGEEFSKIVDGQGFKPSYQEGLLKEMIEFRDGRAEGLVKRFSKEGFLESEYMVKEGMRHGEERVFYLSRKGEPKIKLTIDWYEDEIHGMVKTYFKNGVLESQREVSHNKKQGMAFGWYRDGGLMLVEEYENDRLIKGSYMKPGMKEPTSTIINGSGEALLYDGYGTLLRRVRYENGRPQDN